MIEDKILIALVGAVVTLSQGGVIALQILARRERKSEPEKEVVSIDKVIKVINGNMKGGNGMCLDHEKRLTTTETRQLNIIKGMDEWRTENAKAHDAIFNKLDAIVK